MSRALLRALFPLLLVAACNIYNPSGKGDPETTRDWIDQGNAQLRSLEFPQAQASFGHVLASDSGNTAAWIGYTKAVAGQHLDVSLLLREIVEANRQDRKPLWDMSCQRKDSAFRSIAPVWVVYHRWERLDSLGRAKMPTDQKTELGLLTIAHTMLALWDVNGDGRIDSLQGDGIAWTLFDTKNTEGGFKPRLENVEFSVDTTGTVDQDAVTEYNALLSRSATDIAAVKALAGLDPSMGTLYASLGEQNPDALAMYLVSDGTDNDLDGCADEEVQDSLDNDGDGLVDEDARAGYVLKSTRAPIPGTLALRAAADGIRGDRLADATGKGGVGSDSASTLVYGDTLGHLLVFAPLWDSTRTRHPELRWNTTCPADGGPCAGSLREIGNRLAVSDSLREVAPGLPRAQAGCALLGGCWCKQLADIHGTGVSR